MRKLHLTGAFLFCLFILHAGNSVPDQSLTLKEYEKRGVPAVTKNAWSLNEFSTAINKLEELKSENPALLPLKGSKKSGALFEKLLSREIIKVLGDTTRSYADRVNSVMPYISSVSRLLNLYFDPGQAKQLHSKEVLNIMDFYMDLMSAVMGVTYMVIASPNSGIKSNEGLEQARAGYNLFSHGLVATMGSESAYEKEDLIFFSKKLKLFLEKSWPWYDEKTRTELKANINSIIAKTSISQVRDNLKGMKLR